MKFLVALALVAIVAARPGDHYDAKFESLNIKEIVESYRLLNAYVDCLTNKGKCTPEGKELRELIPEAVQTSCEKCTETQKTMIATFIVATQEKLPEKWSILNGQHNPEGKYNEILENFLKEYKH